MQNEIRTAVAPVTMRVGSYRACPATPMHSETRMGVAPVTMRVGSYSTVIRLYINQPLNEGEYCQLDAEAAHYLRQVMRQQVGMPIVLFNATGGEFLAEITALHRQGGECSVRRFEDVSRELSRPVHIIQTANKSEKIEQVLQKGTELGASAFTITISERSQLQLSGNRLQKRLQRWNKIIIEAAEQSGRTMIPTLQWLPNLAQLSFNHDFGFFLHPEAENYFSEACETINTASGIRLAIGPEGGWSSRDCQQLEGLGLKPLRFGERILRTETAAPAVLAAIQAVWAFHDQ